MCDRTTAVERFNVRADCCTFALQDRGHTDFFHFFFFTSFRHVYRGGRDIYPPALFSDIHY